MIESISFAPDKIITPILASYSLPPLLSALFWICVLYSFIHAAIIVYHWHAYNIAEVSLKRKTITIYLSGTIFFLLFMGLSLSLITP